MRVSCEVELAQLRHLATRLVRGWTHLERQKAGSVCVVRVKTQLETDRRLLRNRIVQIQSRLERVEKQREQRHRVSKPMFLLFRWWDIPTPANLPFQSHHRSAGLRGRPVVCHLDPTLRRIDVMDVGETVLADVP